MPAKFPELFINGITLERETVTKFLGVFIDKNVTWRVHIIKISPKISKIIGIFFYSKANNSKKQLNRICFSFAHGYLNYANLVWGSTRKTKFSTLYRQQKQSIRLLDFKDQFAYSKSLFKETGTLNIYEINIFNILCLMFKCKKNLVPKLSKIYLPLNQKINIS